MFQVEKYQKACRKLIPEGIVLLKNLNGVLPLNSSDKIALFSRGQFEYVKSGSGSGGRVNCPYITQFYDEFSSRAQLDEEVSAFYRDFIAEKRRKCRTNNEKQRSRRHLKTAENKTRRKNHA